MRAFVAVAASVVLMGLTGVAQAEKLLSLPLPTSINTSGACYIRNIGATAVTVQVSLF